MNIKLHVIIPITVAFLTMQASSMFTEKRWLCKKSIPLPSKILSVEIARDAKKVTYNGSQDITIQSLVSEDKQTIAKKASCISFDDSSCYLAMITSDAGIQIFNVEQKNIASFPQMPKEQYTVIRCVNEKECLVGTDKGMLWRAQVDKYPQLLLTYKTKYKNPNCRVIACDKKNNSFGVAMLDYFDSNELFAGDVEDPNKGWFDSTGICQTEDIRFSDDGSLVAFTTGKTVLVYITALLETSQQVWRENNNMYNDNVKKLFDSMLKVVFNCPEIVQKIIFHNNNTEMLMGLIDGTIHCGEINSEGNPKEPKDTKEIIKFGEPIVSLAFDDAILAVASLNKVSLYSKKD